MSDKGFTLIEILIVLSVAVILTTTGFISYNNYKVRNDVELSTREVASAVQDVQRRSVTQEDGNRWSIRFISSSTGSDRYQIYTGNSYSTSSVHRSYSFNRPVHFSEPADDRTIDLQFEPISGSLSNKKIISIVHDSGGDSVGEIIVNTLGSVTQRMLDNVVGYWHFNKGSGATTTDVSGKDNDGSINGASWATENSCIVGQCLDFNGSSDYVNFGSNSNLNPVSEITISVWINGDSFDGTGTNNIVTRWNSGSDWSYILRVRDGSMRYQVQNSSDTSATVSGSSPSTGAWHHIALVYDGSQLKGYFDGSEDGTAQSLSGDIKEVSVNTLVGARNNGGTPADFFNGKIDEVKIYNTALSSTTINNLYNNLK